MALYTGKGNFPLTDYTLGIRKARGFRLQSCQHRKGKFVGSLQLKSEVCGRVFGKHPYESELMQFCTICFAQLRDIFHVPKHF